MRMSVWRGSARPRAGHWQLPARWTSLQRRPRTSCASFATCISERKLRTPIEENSASVGPSEPGQRMNKDSDNHPAIRTELPGPKARALLARDAEVVSPSYPREYPFAMSHGRGVEVWDVDGNRFLDFAAGIAVCSTGHSHPQVVQAIKNAADEFLHISPDFSHERQVALGQKINALSPMGEPVLSFFCQSGTEAAEAALRLAR